MKIGIIAIVLFLTTSLLIGEEAKAEEMFFKYQKAQNYENFKNAVELYNHNPNAEISNTSVLMLSYLYTMELNRNLDILGQRRDSLSTKTKFSYANLLLELGRLEEAIDVYSELNKDFPIWSCPWRHKGQALLEQEKFEAAEKSTLKAIETREDHFDAYLQLARIQIELGKYEIALQTLNNGMKYSETDTEGEVTDQEVIELKTQLEELLKAE
ncbi:MAG: tetratricopeptide repeat protein [Candidatus Cloacimonetes bacterium]|nr:tetratricopeptide repeat protein [Candidatus Cloacimonadota bacterium]